MDIQRVPIKIPLADFKQYSANNYGIFLNQSYIFFTRAKFLAYTLYYYYHPTRAALGITPPSINFHHEWRRVSSKSPEYQLSSRVATSQLKEPRAPLREKNACTACVIRQRGLALFSYYIMIFLLIEMVPMGGQQQGPTTPLIMPNSNTFFISHPRMNTTPTIGRTKTEDGDITKHIVGGLISVED